MLQPALSRLRASSSSRPALVLTGHSLGAGVVELLAVLLLGGGGGDGGDFDARLKMYLYAPPPAYRFGADGERQTRRQENSSEAKDRAAVLAAMECAVAFTLNYDIIPRTSLHNGYNLFQQGRAVDGYVHWRKRKIVKRLRDLNASFPQQAAKSCDSIVEAVSAAIEAAAAGPPAAPNPFAKQHPVAARVYHIVGTAHGTSASPIRLPASASGIAAAEEQEEEPAGRTASSSSSRAATAASRVCASIPYDPAAAQPSEGGVVGAVSALYKRSRVLKEWRWRYTWVADGCLRFSYDAERRRCTLAVPITAAATTISLQGGPSSETFPESIVVRADSAAPAPSDAGCQGACRLGQGSPPPTEWTFTVQTAATEGAQSQPAVIVDLCAGSQQIRDAWVRLIAAEVARARCRCFAARPALRPEAWGTEALLADGFAADHSMLRYEAALESLAERCRPGPGSGPTGEAEAEA